MTERRVSLLPATGVQPAATRWAWEGRIPLGAPTILAGREGLGKSTLSVELAARASRGDLPGDLAGKPACVIYASAEDSPASTLVPRLIAAGADLDKVALLNVTVAESGEHVETALNLPADVPELKRSMAEVGARLLFLDPLVSYIPSNVNTFRDQHVRRVLTPLARMAADLDAAVVAIAHLNKGESLDALARVGGSVGFTAAARSVLLFAADPSDPEGEAGSRRVLAHAKCNVGRKRPALGARIEPRVIDGENGEAIPTSRLVLLEETNQSPSDLLGPPTSSEDRTARDEAVEFLRDELGSGPLSANAIKQRAREAGIADRTLDRAKAAAGVRSRKLESGWVWTLNSATPSITGGVGALGAVAPLNPPKDAKNVKNAIGGNSDSLFPEAA